MICKAKMAYKFTWTNAGEIAKVSIMGAGISWVASYFGIVHFNYTTFTETYMKIAIEYWGITLLKDYTMMYFVHPWMHKPENYWMHKHHHLVGVEVQANHGFSISNLDAFIENDIGLFLFFFVQWLITGQISCHLASFYMVGWHDIIVHSLNPYSIVHFNPLLEYYIKPTLEHNLHHMIQRDYYVFNSFRHLFSTERRDQDLAKYNELCKTTMSYDLWVDDKKNIAY